MKWIKWKCDDCEQEFITGEIDEPCCPDCGYDWSVEIGEVEVIDKR